MAHVEFSEPPPGRDLGNGDRGHGHGPPFCPPPFADGDWPGHAHPPPLHDICGPDSVPEPDTVILVALAATIAILGYSIHRWRKDRDTPGRK